MRIRIRRHWFFRRFFLRHGDDLLDAEVGDLLRRQVDVVEALLLIYWWYSDLLRRCSASKRVLVRLLEQQIVGRLITGWASSAAKLMSNRLLHSVPHQLFLVELPLDQTRGAASGEEVALTR